MSIAEILGADPVGGNWSVDWDVLCGGNCTFIDEKIADVNDKYMFETL